jgi:hypothetical protein
VSDEEKKVFNTQVLALGSIDFLHSSNRQTVPFNRLNIMSVSSTFLAETFNQFQSFSVNKTICLHSLFVYAFLYYSCHLPSLSLSCSIQSFFLSLSWSKAMLSPGNTN